MPLLSAFGPFTAPQLLRGGRHVRAIGAVFPAVLAQDVFGVPAPKLVNQIVARTICGRPNDVERLRDVVCERPLPHPLARLPDAVLAGCATGASLQDRTVGRVAADGTTWPHIDRRCGHALRYQSPAVRARLPRSDRFVAEALCAHRPLSGARARTAVERRGGVGVGGLGHRLLRSGPHDQRVPRLCGRVPTTFFKPHDPAIDSSHIRVRGRPSEWLRPHE